jgi:hypothetical protein
MHRGSDGRKPRKALPLSSREFPSERISRQMSSFSTIVDPETDRRMKIPTSAAADLPPAPSLSVARRSQRRSAPNSKVSPVRDRAVIEKLSPRVARRVIDESSMEVEK